MVVRILDSCNVNCMVVRILDRSNVNCMVVRILDSCNVNCMVVRILDSCNVNCMVVRILDSYSVYVSHRDCSAATKLFLFNCGFWDALGSSDNAAASGTMIVHMCGALVP
jgi:hypothetical protein